MKNNKKKITLTLAVLSWTAILSSSAFAFWDMPSNWGQNNSYSQKETQVQPASQGSYSHPETPSQGNSMPSQPSMWSGFRKGATSVRSYMKDQKNDFANFKANFKAERERIRKKTAQERIQWLKYYTQAFWSISNLKEKKQEIETKMKSVKATIIKLMKEAKETTDANKKAILNETVTALKEQQSELFNEFNVLQSKILEFLNAWTERYKEALQKQGFTDPTLLDKQIALRKQLFNTASSLRATMFTPNKFKIARLKKQLEQEKQAIKANYQAMKAMRKEANQKLKEKKQTMFKTAEEQKFEAVKTVVSKKIDTILQSKLYNRISKLSVAKQTKVLDKILSRIQTIKQKMAKADAWKTGLRTKLKAFIIDDLEKNVMAYKDKITGNTASLTDTTTAVNDILNFNN